MTDNKSPKFVIFGGTEKTAIVVILLLVFGNLLIKQSQIAVGVGVGGLLFLLDFMGIKFIVNSVLSNRYSNGFSLFVFIIKLTVLLGILFALLVFAKLNIYGFIIALTALVLIIVGKGLKGTHNGTL